jgi:rod shape-determining protein MreC
VEAALGDVLTPVQRTLTGFGDQVMSVFTGAKSLQELRARTAELEAEVDRLRTENVKVGDLKAEILKLRDLANFPRLRPDLDIVGASLVGHTTAEDPGNVRRIVRLDVGRDQGVTRRMPVAEDRGLVGQVISVSKGWSDVMLITDPDSRVEGRVQRSGATGMIFGTPTGELVMRYLPQNSPGEPPVVQVDDLVLTSGLSARFPAELLVGQVVDVHQSDVETHQEALIRPSVDFNALALVLVVRDWQPVTDPVAGDGP